MKYRLISLFLILISIIPVYSQWGIKGGLNGDWIKPHFYSDPRLGFHLGVTYDFLLSDKLYLQPGLLFTTLGKNRKTAFNPSAEQGKGFIEIYALEAPLQLSFRPPIGKQANFVLDIGLYVRQGLFGRDHMTYNSENTIKKSPFNQFNRSDVGFNIGAGFLFNRIYTGLIYQQGLTDAEKDGSSQHTSFRLSLGYKL